MSAAEAAANLGAYTLQVAGVVVVAGLLDALFPIDRARVRLAFWNGVLLLCLLLPFVQPWSRPAAAADVVEAVTADVADDAAVPGTGAPLEPLAAPWVSRVNGAVVILGIVAAGAAVGVLRLLRSFIVLRRLRRRSRLTSVETSSGAELRLSDDIASPVTFGLRPPVVLLPAAFEALAPEERRGVVCHEIVHVERRHWLAQLFEESLRAALWFHPAFHWLLGRIRLAREQSVDAEVVRRLHGREAYLEALVRLAASAHGRALAPAPSFFTRSHLAERVDLLLKEKPMSKARVLLSVLASAAAVGAIAVAGTAVAPLHAAIPVAPVPAEEQMPPAAVGGSRVPLPPLPPMAADAPQPPVPPVEVPAAEAPEPPELPEHDLPLAPIPPRVPAVFPVPAAEPAPHPPVARLHGEIDAEMRESMEELRRSLREQRAELDAARKAMEIARRELREAADELARLGEGRGRGARTERDHAAIDREAHAKALAEGARAREEAERAREEALKAVEAVKEDIRRAAEAAAHGMAERKRIEAQEVEQEAHRRHAREQARRQAEEVRAHREEERARREAERAKREAERKREEERRRERRDAPEN